MDGKNMTSGQKIRKLRRERDWTQADLGERAGINFRNINRYESDRLKPGIKVITKLAEAFGVAVDDLLEDAARPSEVQVMDPELFHCFQQIEKMVEEDRAAIKRLLQAMIIKHQVQDLGRLAS